jgi:hypothetical protein
MLKCIDVFSNAVVRTKIRIFLKFIQFSQNALPWYVPSHICHIISYPRLGIRG